MALTKVSRGLLTTSIVDNGNATAITIDASENVGVGNTSPSSYFSNSRNLVVGGTTGANGMTISGSTDTQIFFADGTSGADAYRGIIRYSHADDGFSFWTNATRVLDIDSSGSVGISTTDPKSSLEVKGTFGAPATSGSAAGFISRFSQSSGVGCLDFGFGDPYSWIQSRASNNYATNFDLTLQPNGGKVGIGTSSPRSILDLDGGSETQLRLQTTNTGSASSDGLLISLDSSANAQAYLWNYENAAMIFGTNATERLRIAADGSISIPNQNAINELTFTGTEFTNVLSATTSGFNFGTTGAGYLAFITNNTSRATIDSAGNFIVGNTTAFSSSSFCVDQSGLGQFRRDGTPLNIRRDGSNGDLISFEKDGGTVGSIGVDANVHIAINAASGTGKLKVGSVTRYNWDANQFYPEQDNARDLGFPSLRWDDVYSTGGINTSDRNEKQDIEELSSAEQRVAVACKGLMRKFRWKSAVIDKGDDARIHVGIMAQDLQAAFESEGLDPARYGMWCSNTWTDEETGEEITRMSVRYNELLAFIISAI